ncbi:MAG: BrnT family toxin [Acidobacteria bacterium]|nr:BrnT family toxin [Acidobacteriota bacterium]
MVFGWDENKNRTNIAKHRIDFADVLQMFDGPMQVEPDTREDYGEDRWVGIGLLRNIVAVVVFAEPSTDTIRIISARKANKYERTKFEQWLAE